MESTSVPPPTGQCWCGCVEKPSEDKHFVHTHDRTAEAAVIKVEYRSIAAFLHNHGYGPNGKRVLSRNARSSRLRVESGRGGLALVERIHAGAAPGLVGDLRVVDPRGDLVLGQAMLFRQRP